MTKKLEKNLHIRTAAIVSAFFIAGAVITSGCSAKNSTPAQAPIPDKSGGSKTSQSADPAAEKTNVQEKIKNDLAALLAGNPEAAALIRFVDKNISQVSRDDASKMVLHIEDAQKKNFEKLEEQYYKSEDIQIGLRKIYKPEFDFSGIDAIADKKLKELLIETRDNGFRVETAEGSYFPIINYQTYKNYVSYVTPDIGEYIGLMAVESNKVPAKDAAIVIGWDDVLSRALNQEKYIGSYSSSPRIKEVRELYKKYLSFVFLGANNTPLFSYDTKIMLPAAKTVYSDSVKNAGNSKLLGTLSEFIKLLDKNSYKLTDEVDRFRKSSIDSILSVK